MTVCTFIFIFLLFINFLDLSKDDAPKTTTKGWGKPPVAQTVAPVQSLLESNHSFSFVQLM